MSKEVLLVVESVSNEKGVPASVIFEALELALATATKKRFEDEVELRVAINRQTGNYETFRCWTVVEESDFDDPAHQVTTDMPRAVEANAKVGEVLEEKIDSIEFGRIAAQTAKQVIVQKVREAERAQVVEAYRERLGEIISGTVKKVTRDSVIVDLGNNAEAMLAREDIISRETFRVGVRLRALLKEIRTENRGPQLILSRTAPEMLIELFRIEVPEIAEELIEVMGASRDPGSRPSWLCAPKTNASTRRVPVSACAVRVYRRFPASWRVNVWISCCGMTIPRSS
jgi:transcription termination/antitermination protein NusA